MSVLGVFSGLVLFLASAYVVRGYVQLSHWAMQPSKDSEIAWKMEGK